MGYLPTHAIVSVTERCNARCVMCDIWKRKPPTEMEPACYERLPASLTEVNISGGEPLLREDTSRVIEALRKVNPRMRIVLSTNGLLPAKLEVLLRKSRGIAVRVSLDALGQLNDTIRGVDGAYERAIESIDLAIRMGVKDVGICSTMITANVKSIREVQRLARSRGISFTVTIAHSSKIFFGDQSHQIPQPDIAIKELGLMKRAFYRSPRIKDWFKGYFVDGLIDVLKGSPRPVECRAGRDFFYLDPKGNVYPCHLWETSMGDICEESYKNIIARSRKTLEAVRHCDKKCWMTCTVAPMLRRRILRYVFPVLIGKIGSHLTHDMDDEDTTS